MFRCAGLLRGCREAVGELAIERDTTINALAIEAFNDLLKKYGKRQSVENPLLDCGPVGRGIRNLMLCDEGAAWR